MILNEVASILGYPILSMTSVSGGDINETFQLKAETGEQYFLKFNRVPQAHSMFLCEKEGLRILDKAVKYSVPEVILASKLSIGGCLVMHFEAPIGWENKAYIRLGEMLAGIHRTSSDKFGFHQDNYLATLNQQNDWNGDFVSFYLYQRLVPLIKKAIDAGLLESRYSFWGEKSENSLRAMIPEESPALLHGDLWSGNVMNTRKGPLFIDPAVYYGHREIDVAMTKMFGGFKKEFYEAYMHYFPLEKNWKERIPLFQLYPYLVHLVLFGSSYTRSTKSILDRYW